MANPDDHPPRLVTLEEWGRRQYGDAAPAIGTLRRWCREARITPAPQKHGQSYFVHPDARYINPADPESYDLSWVRKE